VASKLRGATFPHAEVEEVGSSVLRNWDSVDVMWIHSAPARDNSPNTNEFGITFENWDLGFEEIVQAWNPTRRIVVLSDTQNFGEAKAIAARLSLQMGVRPVYWTKGKQK
jgi:hypothetical protein